MVENVCVCVCSAQYIFGYSQKMSLVSMHTLDAFLDARGYSSTTTDETTNMVKTINKEQDRMI